MCGRGWCDCSEAMSVRGAFGNRMPPSRGCAISPVTGGDWDVRGIGKEAAEGELKPDEGVDDIEPGVAGCDE